MLCGFVVLVFYRTCYFTWSFTWYDHTSIRESLDLVKIGGTSPWTNLSWTSLDLSFPNSSCILSLSASLSLRRINAFIRVWSCYKADLKSRYLVMCSRSRWSYPKQSPSSVCWTCGRSEPSDRILISWMKRMDDGALPDASSTGIRLRY